MLLFHQRALQQQLEQVYVGMALAAAAGRAFILPQLQCFCQNAAQPLPRCRRPDSAQLQFPADCPEGDVLMPLPDFSSGGEAQGMPLQVEPHSAAQGIESGQTLVLRPSATILWPKCAGTPPDPATPENSKACLKEGTEDGTAVLSLPPSLNDTHLLPFLESYQKYKLWRLDFSDVGSPWHAFAGWECAEPAKQFDQRLSRAVKPWPAPNGSGMQQLGMTAGPSAWTVAYDKTIFASGARNPNGCRPPMTWFTTCCPRGRREGSCEVVTKAHSLGHELATHTKTHPQGGDSMSYAAWREELGGQRDWLVKECGVPAADVAGFRAPYFKLNGALGAALQDSGFLYDSSISGKDPHQMAAPMHAFNLSACAAAGCGNWSSLSIWEVPAYTLPGKGPQAFRRVDPAPLPGMPVLERLKADFERKRGSGVPVSVMVHEAYLTDSTTRQPIVQFLRWALAQPGTWALTYRQYVEWRRAPPGTQAQTTRHARHAASQPSLVVSSSVPTPGAGHHQETPPLLETAHPSNPGCAADEVEKLRQRLAEAQRRLVAAEQAAERMHEADAKALAAELEARKQLTTAADNAHAGRKMAEEQATKEQALRRQAEKREAEARQEADAAKDAARASAASATAATEAQRKAEQAAEAAQEQAAAHRETAETAKQAAAVATAGQQEAEGKAAAATQAAQQADAARQRAEEERDTAVAAADKAVRASEARAAEATKGRDKAQAREQAERQAKLRAEASEAQCKAERLNAEAREIAAAEGQARLEKSVQCALDRLQSLGQAVDAVTLCA
ncbi:kinetoplast DNA-associated [Chlorella sorokiniana]|uniref:Kinetoplast DNA-associated n=1 Tax=Chlorella sorokiniana TaxID=3076 RepID=A0A2P6TIB3_CHLSO|nr:kinetoplast DNA-associated [Chlorella sorokiniana]|eukprot:PRW34035.1 kinetoplast DNA-associated [Chlorella sorokiniana]